ncbi:hypothetical protein K438DRAFT_1952989 [Mycena galopus ATCC 62051]|nr:hypothetical protein K438DRAFT_1952989 [Mycena galopus ATCC 62051]
MSGGMIQGCRHTTGPAGNPRVTRQASKTAVIADSPGTATSNPSLDTGAVESPSAAGGAGGTPGPFVLLGPGSLVSEDSTMPGLQTVSDSSVSASASEYVEEGVFLGNIMQATEHCSGNLPPHGNGSTMLVHAVPEDGNKTLACFYRDCATGKAIKSSNTPILFEFDAVNSGKAVVPEGVHPTIQFSRVPPLPVLQLLSTVGQSTVNTLPGVGRLPSGWNSVSVAVSSGAFLLRAVPFPEGTSLREVRNALLPPSTLATATPSAERSYIGTVVPVPLEPIVANMFEKANDSGLARRIGVEWPVTQSTPRVLMALMGLPRAHPQAAVEALVAAAVEVDSSSPTTLAEEVGHQMEVTGRMGLPSIRPKAGMEVVAEAWQEQEVEARPVAEGLPLEILDAAEVEAYLVAGEVEINRKLALSLVPEWDGHGKTAITYICKVAELLWLSPQMSIDLGVVAPLKFRDWVLTWWMTQTPTVRAYLSQDWGLLLQAIQAHFLNANWLQDCCREWEEMRFCQRGHNYDIFYRCKL